MKLTSKDANKLLKQLEEEINSIETNEKNSSTFVAATVENKEDVRPEYNFKETQNKLNELKNKVIKLKHEINTFNINTIVPEFDMTIDEMLVYIPQLSLNKLKLARMKDKPKFIRLSNSRTNIIDYQYINYDLTEVNDEYKAVESELNRAQIALDKVNITATFDVEL